MKYMVSLLVLAFVAFFFTQLSFGQDIEKQHTLADGRLDYIEIYAHPKPIYLIGRVARVDGQSATIFFVGDVNGNKLNYNNIQISVPMTCVRSVSRFDNTKFCRYDIVRTTQIGFSVQIDHRQIPFIPTTVGNTIQLPQGFVIDRTTNASMQEAGMAKYKSIYERPATQPSTRPTTQPDTQPAPSSNPATQASTQPSTQPATQPATQPDTQPAPSTSPTTQPSSKDGFITI